MRALKFNCANVLALAFAQNMYAPNFSRFTVMIPIYPSPKLHFNWYKQVLIFYALSPSYPKWTIKENILLFKSRAEEEILNKIITFEITLEYLGCHRCRTHIQRGEGNQLENSLKSKQNKHIYKKGKGFEKSSQFRMVKPSFWFH